jgi:ribonucleoside-diphosphate reductase alpha chain
MLPPYGARPLGQINLAALVQRPFEADAAIDEGELCELTRTAVHARQVTISGHLLPQQEAEACRSGGSVSDHRPMRCCSAVQSRQRARRRVTRRLEIIKREAWSSAEIAAEKGPSRSMIHASWSAELGSRRGNARVIVEHGLQRCLTSIAPTGTTSLLAGNVSSDRAVFAFSYKRKIRNTDGSTREEQAEDYAMRVWRDQGRRLTAAGVVVSAQTLTPSDHLTMQAAAQALVDSSISKPSTVLRILV